MKPGISVVIPSRPFEPHLQECLDSLRAQDFSDFEVIVIFNPDQKMNLQNLNFGPKLRISKSSKGANFARNKGIQLCQYELVLFIDSDCMIRDPKFLKKYFEIMQNNLHLTAAGGPYHLPFSSLPIDRAYHFIQNNWILNSVMGSDFQTHNLLGGNMIFRISNLGEFRFDESFVFGGTETELFSRLVANGHHFKFIADQSVEHLTQLSIKDLKRKAKMQGLGRRRILGVHSDKKKIRIGIGLPVPNSEVCHYISIYRNEFTRAENLDGFFKQIMSLLRSFRERINICQEISRNRKCSHRILENM